MICSVFTSATLKGVLRPVGVGADVAEVSFVTELKSPGSPMKSVQESSVILNQLVRCFRCPRVTCWLPGAPWLPIYFYNCHMAGCVPQDGSMA